MSILLGIGSFILFILFQAHYIPAGDSGDLVTAAATFGVAHPPGYPLYTFLGWLAAHIPVSTVVWRVGLLSSLSHAFVIIFVYEIVLLLTRKRSAAIFSSLFILGNYVFFLYSITPEVFALLDLFIVLLIWLSLRWHKTNSIRYVYSVIFIMGLSLTHHQVILFFFPALAYLFWQKRTQLIGRVSPLRAAGAFFAGLLPYLYVPVAASGSSMINWNQATTLSNFIRLVTRVDYGTFQSGAFIGALPIQRFLQIQAYLQYLVLDVTWVGIIFLLGGLVYIWRNNRPFFWFFLIAALCLGPLFLFYASFPMVNRFTLGTYERFLLPSYVVLSVLIGLGYSYVIDKTKKIFNTVLSIGIAGACFLYIFYLAGLTVWKFVGYANDQTSRNTAMDILDNLPQGSVFLVDRDTVLFTTQYERYVDRVRPDVAVIHGNRIGSADYQKVVRHTFPTLPVDMIHDTSSFTDFMKSIASSGRLFSYTKYSMDEGWYWVPYGLVYRLMNTNQLSDLDSVYATNIRIWDSMHDPSKGILSHYNHLMVSDVSDVYTSARVNFGKVLFRAGNYTEAKRQLMKAITYNGDTDLSDAYTYLGLCDSVLKNCTAALADFDQAGKTAVVPENAILYYEGITYRDCVGDAERAQEFFDAYAKKNGTAQTLLEQL